MYFVITALPRPPIRQWPLLASGALGCLHAPPCPPEYPGACPRKKTSTNMTSEAPLCKISWNSCQDLGLS